MCLAFNDNIKLTGYTVLNLQQPASMLHFSIMMLFQSLKCTTLSIESDILKRLKKQW